MGLRGRRARSHTQLMRDELGESFDHFVQAASHVAGGMGATVGPRVSAAKDFVAPGVDRVRGAANNGWDTTVAALAPFVVAAREGAQQAREAQLKAMKKKQKASRNRWSVLVALAAAGAAVGAGAAYLARKRRQLQWAEYDPGQALESTGEDVKSTVDKIADDTQSTARKAADKTSAASSKTTNKVKESADELVRKAGSPGKNSRG